MEKDSKGRFIGGVGFWKGRKLTEEARLKMSLARKGKEPWNKGIPCSKQAKEKIGLANTGRKISEETRQKLKGKIEEKSPCWKGDKAGKCAMHCWVEKWKGKPSLCEMCGKTNSKKFEWANVDHLYKRILEDYIRMCTSCHRKFDITNNYYKNK